MSSSKSQKDGRTDQTMMARVGDHVATAAGDKPARIGPETMLFSSLATFDSFAMLELVMRLESSFALSIPDEALDRDIFRSPQTIVTYLCWRLRIAPPEKPV